MFETTGILNEEILNELKKYAMPPKRKKLFKIYSIILGLLGLVDIIIGVLNSRNRSILFGLGFLFLSTVAIWVIIYFEKRFMRLNMKILEESTDTRELKIRVFFDEDGAIINNLTTSSSIKIKYEYFVRIVETASIYFLVTDSNLYAIVAKECLSNDELDEFKKFIKGKCKNIQ